jgi:hypothetical protein
MQKALDSIPSIKKKKKNKTHKTKHLGLGAWLSGSIPA